MTGDFSAADFHPSATRPVGWGFVTLYALAYLGTILVLLAPVLVTLALKVNALVGIERAPASLGLVTGLGSLVALVGNPLFGRLSDRTTSRFGMRRPWMIIGLVGGSLGVLVVAVAPSIPVVLVGWCSAQAVLQRAPGRHGRRAARPGPGRATRPGVRCPGHLSAHRVGERHLPGPAVHRQPARHVPRPVCHRRRLILLFAATLNDRRLDAADRPTWSVRELAGTFYLSPRTSPDFAWAFTSRFLFVLAYAFLATYQAYYLLEKINSAEAEVPYRIFLGTLLQAAAIIVASIVGGRLSDRTGRRKIFVVTASLVYGLALFVIALATTFNGYLVGMAIGGLGFGLYLAVDLALVADVLPEESRGKDLGVFNIAAALPFAIAPTIAPAILAAGGGSYSVLYAVAGVSAVLGAVAILPVKGVR